MSARPFTAGRALLRHWCRHRRASAKDGLARLAAVPDYLRRTYEIDTAWSLPATLLQRGVTRLRGAG